MPSRARPFAADAQRLRAATSGDSALIRALAEAWHGETTGPIDAQAEAIALVMVLGSPGLSAWIVEAGNASIGYAIAALAPAAPPGEAVLEELFVDRAHRGAGIAAAILLLLCDLLAARGIGLLLVAVDWRDDRAACYYRLHGFAPHRPGLAGRRLTPRGER